MTDSNLEIGEMEQSGGNKDQDYSRSQLLMRATQRVLETGAREKKPGFLIVKRDKMGNEIRLLSDDTRKSFCEAVEILRNLSECDFDKDCKDELKVIDKSINDKRTELLDKEWDGWANLTAGQRAFKLKSKFFVAPVKGAFSSKEIYYEQFLVFNLKKHKDIFQVLTRLSKRMDFHSGQSFES